MLRHIPLRRTDGCDTDTLSNMGSCLQELWLSTRVLLLLIVHNQSHGMAPGKNAVETHDTVHSQRPH